MNYTQAIDTGVEETLSDSHANLLESLDSTTNLVGQLMLERRVQERVMAGRLQPAREGSVSSTSDDFLSEQVKTHLAVVVSNEHANESQEHLMTWRTSTELRKSYGLACQLYNVMCIHVN